MDQMSTEEKGILYLFEKPTEPLRMLRANNRVRYNLPAEILPENFRGQPEVSTRRAGGGVSLLGEDESFVFDESVTNIDIDLVAEAQFENLPETVRSIPRGVMFSHFVPQHRRAANDLTNLFLSQSGLKGLLNYAANVRDFVNETLFVCCLSFAMLRKPEVRPIAAPPLIETMPSNFIPKATLDKADQMARLEETLASSPEITVVDHDFDFSGTNFNPENRVAYWREDYGLNNHHWHWHLIFPIDMETVQPDRRGEIFYYMHQQMMARYDMERLCNNLLRVEPLSNFRQPIPVGYFSKLTFLNSGRNFGTRQDNTVMSDYAGAGPIEAFSVNDLELWRQRILDGIHQGYFINKTGLKVMLSDDVNISTGAKRGIDIIGNTIEADRHTSANFRLYGDLHNLGHIALAACHDPSGIHKEEGSVMGFSATAMRDPVFYRWHRFINNVFDSYKLGQEPYTNCELAVDGLKIKNIGISSGMDGYLIKTFHDAKRLTASRGLQFKSSRPVEINITRINHEPFTYHIVVDNEKRCKIEVTVRIFLAPKHNEAGDAMNLMDQRLFWAEMDKFHYTMECGENSITRESTESSITTDEELTFREREQGTVTDPSRSEAFCGCGWPQHLLVPRGKESGMPFQLFVLLSDYNMDKVSHMEPSRSRCGKAVSYCGLLDEKFPDKRPMGFPFDRRPLPDVKRISDFVTKFPNSAVTDISIQYTGPKNESTLTG